MKYVLIARVIGFFLSVIAVKCISFNVVVIRWSCEVWGCSEEANRVP